MKIALMQEFSQAAKNPVVLAQLETVAADKGHTIFNVGMDGDNDHRLTYIHLGIVASLPSKWRAPVRGLNYPGNPTSAIPPIGWNPAGGTPPRAGPFRLSSMLSRLAWRVWSCAIGSSAWRRFG